METKTYTIKEYKPGECIEHTTDDEGLYNYVNRLTDALNIAIDGLSYTAKNASDRCQKEDNKKEVNTLIDYMARIQKLFK